MPAGRAERAALGGAALVVGGGVAVAARAAWFEPRRLVVRRETLHLPRWPRSLDGCTVALVSDLHAGGPHVGLERVRRIVARTNRLRPDLVTVLGDVVDPCVTFGEELAPEAVGDALAGLRAPLGVVAVLGNHDWTTDGPRVAAALRDAGMRVLENEACPVPARAPLWVAGVADATERDPDVGAALARVPDDAPVLLLSHDPDVFPRVPGRVALTLSGHTHGGQVAVPVARRRWTPSRFGERYAGGHVVEDGRHLVISRGIGESRHPVRLGAPPEIVLVRLRARRGS